MFDAYHHHRFGTVAADAAAVAVAAFAAAAATAAAFEHLGSNSCFLQFTNYLDQRLFTVLKHFHRKIVELL